MALDTDALMQAASDDLEVRTGFAQVGILEKVRVDNFMCHRSFEFVFGPNINIINGQNGSGKSAIVAALQIGLGVKATKTERARRISDHIMHGKDWAMISIRIRNHAAEDGDTGLCFRREAYGDAVVVERKITKSSTVLTFKNARGHRVAPERSSRAELDAILDTFNLQVDNPIAILTQQKSKQFLLSGKDTAMYDFFMEATLLSAAKEELITIANISREIEVLLKAKRGLRPDIEKHLKVLEASFKEANEMKSLTVRLQELHRKYAWASVGEYEEELKTVSDKLAVLRNELDRVSAAVETRRTKTDAIQVEMSAANDAYDTALEAFTATRKEMAAVEATAKTKKADLDRKLKGVAAATRGVRDAEADVRRAEAEKQRIIKQHLSSSQNKETLAARLDAARAEAEGARLRRERAEEAKTTADADFRRVDQDRSPVVQERSARERELRIAEGDFRGLSRASHNEVAKWGHYMPELMAQIEAAARAGHFHAKPVGPIGSLISVLDRQWARAIQVCVGLGTLNTFLVLDSHDERVLRQLGFSLTSGGGRQIHLNIAIAGINKNRYPITVHDKPNVGHPTMHEMMSVSHHAAFNALVDFARIEQQVLVADPTEHRRVGYTPTPNLATAWTPDASRAYVSSGAQIFRSDASTAAPLLGADMASTIEAAKARVIDAQGALETAKAKFLTHESRVADVRVRATAAKTELDAALRAEGANKAAMQHLEDALEQTTVALDTSANDTEISRCKDDLAEARQRQTACEEAIEELDAAAKEAHARLVEEKAKVDKVAANKEDLQKALQDCHTSLKRSQAKRSQLATNLTEIKEDVAAHEKEVASLTADVAKETKLAVSICKERVDTGGQPSKTLEIEINAHKTRLEAEQARHDDRSVDEIEAELLEAQLRKASNDKDMLSMKQSLASIRRCLIQRKKQLRELTSFLQQLANYYFSKFMRTRGHVGKLIFSGKDRTLRFEIHMKDHINTEEGGLHATTDLRSLSGGERSYTTLCFMLALGESMVLPVRIMDEFDVFMDEANRHAAYKTLVDFARKQLSDRQLIFITPLTLPAVEPGPAVKIQRLNPPTRGG